MMQSTGIQRKMDDMGRIVIPRNLRQMANLAENEMIEFLFDADTHIIGMIIPPKFSEETEKLLYTIKQAASFSFAAAVNGNAWIGSEAIASPQQTYSIKNSRNETIDITINANDVTKNKTNFIFICKLLEA